MTVIDAPASTPDFPVHWDDPADANLTYSMDKMHNPDPISPLQQSLQPSTFYGWQKAMREFGVPFKAMHIRYQNFYQYDRVEMIEPASPEEALSGGEALEATMKARGRSPGRPLERRAPATYSADHRPLHRHGTRQCNGSAG